MWATYSHNKVNESSCDHRWGSNPAGWLPLLSENMWSHHVTKLTEPQSLLYMCIISVRVMAVKGNLVRPSCGSCLVRAVVLKSILSLVGQGNKNILLKKYFTFSFPLWITATVGLVMAISCSHSDMFWCWSENKEVLPLLCNTGTL